MLRELGCFLGWRYWTCLRASAWFREWRAWQDKGGGLALVPCLLAFWGLGTVGNVAQAEKFTVPFAVFAIRHGKKCDIGRKIYRAFCCFRD